MEAIAFPGSSSGGITSFSYSTGFEGCEIVTAVNGTATLNPNIPISIIDDHSHGMPNRYHLPDSDKACFLKDITLRTHGNAPVNIVASPGIVQLSAGHPHERFVTVPGSSQISVTKDAPRFPNASADELVLGAGSLASSTDIDHLGDVIVASSANMGPFSGVSGESVLVGTVARKDISGNHIVNPLDGAVATFPMGATAQAPGFAWDSCAVSTDGTKALFGNAGALGAKGQVASFIITQPTPGTTGGGQIPGQTILSGLIAPSDHVGTANFGADIALSGPSTGMSEPTAYIGGPGDDASRGAIWELSPLRQTGLEPKITSALLGFPSVPGDQFGRSVDITEGGLKGAIGASGSCYAFAFVDAAPAATKLTSSLVDATANQGKSVNINSAANVIVSGAPDHDLASGAVVVWTMAPSTAGTPALTPGFFWVDTLILPPMMGLTGPPFPGLRFGSDVSISSNGKTLVVGNSDGFPADVFTTVDPLTHEWTHQGSLIITERGNYPAPRVPGTQIALESDGGVLSMIGASPSGSGLHVFS